MNNFCFWHFFLRALFRGAVSVKKCWKPCFGGLKVLGSFEDNYTLFHEINKYKTFVYNFLIPDRYLAIYLIRGLGAKFLKQKVCIFVLQEKEYKYV